MVFIQLTNVSTGTIYTSAAPAVGTVVVPATGVASLAQAKHCVEISTFLPFSLCFSESLKSSSIIDLKHMIYLFPVSERKHCKYKCTIQNP